jgi:hypothetical protein
MKTMKSTLKIGFIVATLCVMKKMVTLLQVFHLATEITNNTKSDDSISTVIDWHDNVVNYRCLNAENYLNRRYNFQILMESDHHFIGDDAVTDDDNKKREEAAAVLL